MKKEYPLFTPLSIIDNDGNTVTTWVTGLDDCETIILQAIETFFNLNPGVRETLEHTGKSAHSAFDYRGNCLN